MVVQFDFKVHMGLALTRLFFFFFFFNMSAQRGWKIRSSDPFH
jgi:hypothetical protein